MPTSPEAPILHVGLGNCAMAGQRLRFLAASTEAGLCALLLGECGQEAALLEDLAQRFPTHRRLREPASPPENLPPENLPSKNLPQIQALLEGTRATLDLSLAPQGTAFQQRVWRALQTIPAGTTRTYTQLAQSLDLPPTAVRAVACACAANPIAVAIPCHRVVRGDGSLAGYRWGLATKRTLLQREAEQAMAASGFVLTS